MNKLNSLVPGKFNEILKKKSSLIFKMVSVINDWVSYLMWNCALAQMHVTGTYRLVSNIRRVL